MSGFSEFIAQAQSAVSVLSNPQQSAVLAAGLTGSFSAEVNSLRNQATAALSTFGTEAGSKGPVYQSVVNTLLKPFNQVLGGSPANPIPANSSGKISGFTYWQILIFGVISTMIGLFFLGRLGRK